MPACQQGAALTLTFPTTLYSARAMLATTPSPAAPAAHPAWPTARSPTLLTTCHPHTFIYCRPVTVTRLLVRDSIEHRVLAVQEGKHALFAGTDGAAEDTAGGARGGGVRGRSEEHTSELQSH